MTKAPSSRLSTLNSGEAGSRGWGSSTNMLRLIVPGRYVMSLSVGNNYNYLMDAISQAAFFNVEQKDYFGNGRLPTSDLGVVLSKSHWEFSEI